MIQPAATSANSSLLLGAAMPAGTGEEPAGSVDFAALLGLEVSAAEPAAARDAAALFKALAAPKAATGKQGGKTLPDALPGEAKPNGDSALATEETGHEPGANDPMIALLDAISTPLALFPSQSVAAPPAPVPSAKGEEPRPEASSSAMAQTPLHTLTKALAAAPKPDIESPAAAAASVPGAAVAAPPATAAVTMAVPVGGAQVPAPTPVDVPAPVATATILSAAVAAQPRPVATEGKDARSADRARPLPTAAVSEPVAEQIASAPATPAPAPAPAAAPAPRPVASAEVPVHGDLTEAPLRGETALPQPRADIRQAIAADPQPTIAFGDAQPAPVSASATSAAPAQAAPLAAHDFAKIVDRLVEAREALAPQPVQTSVLTAEFGRVSLRFDQTDAGLTVAMNSADPDFARAVQAAQPAAAAQTADNNASGNPRQDAPAQQNASSNSTQNNGQPGAQSQAQSSARDQQDGQNGSSRTAGRAARNSAEPDDADPRGGGIYA